MIKIQSIHPCFVYSATLSYFGTGEVGVSRGLSGLIPYTADNKAKHGLPTTKKKQLMNAFKEADEAAAASEV